MLKEKEFIEFLRRDPKITSEKAIKSRISKLYDAENILGMTADLIVQSDSLMHKSLITLREHEDISHSVRQNALRKYYEFKNGKIFPKLKEYERK